MASAKKLVAPQFPPLRRPDAKIAETAAVRLGDCAITADFPTLTTPDRKIAEIGAVRLGDCAITAGVASR